jgi:glycosyltransferase involved in cell wall biosynthesis
MALATGIHRLIANPTLRAELGEAARKRAREQFSRQAMVDRFETFYLGLCGTHLGRNAASAKHLNDLSLIR